VTEILERLDPEELVALGAPKDEYKNEAKIIIKRLQSCGSVEELHNALQEIFHERFDIAKTYAKGAIWKVDAPIKIEVVKPPEKRSLILKQAAEEIYALKAVADEVFDC
jgi:hypothetical protein